VGGEVQLSTNMGRKITIYIKKKSGEEKGRREKDPFLRAATTKDGEKKITSATKKVGKKKDDKTTSTTRRPTPKAVKKNVDPKGPRRTLQKRGPVMTPRSWSISAGERISDGRRLYIFRGEYLLYKI